MTIRRYIPRKPGMVEEQSFEAVTALDMTTPTLLEYTSAGKVQKATAVGKAFGVLLYREDYLNSSGLKTGTLDAGDMARVGILGYTIKAVSGGTFTAGGYLAVSSGTVTASGTATKFIAKDTSTASGQTVEVFAL